MIEGSRVFRVGNICQTSPFSLLSKILLEQPVGGAASAVVAASGELAPDVLEVDGGHRDHYLRLGVERAPGEHLAEGLDGGLVAVHLPVAAHEEPPARRHPGHVCLL